MVGAGSLQNLSLREMPPKGVLVRLYRTVSVASKEPVQWKLRGGTHLETAPANPKEEQQKVFTVLPYEEFLALQERLADAEDVLELRKAKRAEGKKKSIPLAAVKRKLGLQ
jgi:hypothetical protein